MTEETTEITDVKIVEEPETDADLESEKKLMKGITQEILDSKVGEQIIEAVLKLYKKTRTRIPMDLTIEDLKDFKIRNNLVWNCRNCGNFIRVHKREDKLNKYDCDGFCACGADGFQLGYDHSHYYCDAWRFSRYNNETFEMETKIRMYRNKLYAAFEDRRTKQYKAVIDYCKKSGIYKEPTHCTIFYQMADVYCDAVLEDQYREIHKRKHLEMRDYESIIRAMKIEIYSKLEPYLQDGEPQIEEVRE